MVTIKGESDIATKRNRTQLMEMSVYLNEPLNIKCFSYAGMIILGTSVVSVGLARYWNRVSEDTVVPSITISMLPDLKDSTGSV